MVRKKMEGGENQRRKQAREARAEGTSPSAEQVTTGASKQRHEQPKHDRHHHQERLEHIHRGKQQDQGPEPRPGSG